MKLEELRWISDLFATCNISRSAENLFISQSALSQCLQRVESELGFPLFDRSNRGLTPTEKGMIFAETAESIMHTYRDFEARISLMDQPDLKEIHIGLAPYAASVCSADLVRRLSETYPAIRFSILDAPTAELMHELKDHRIHMCIVNQSVPKENYESVLFGKMSTVIYLRKGSQTASHAYTYRNRQYLDPVYLKDEKIVRTRSGQASRRISESIYKEAGFVPDVIQETRNISGLYKFALEGIASSVGLLTDTVNSLDEQNHLIYRIPDTYTMASTRWQILIDPNIFKYIPKEVYRIIEDTVKIVTAL